MSSINLIGFAQRHAHLLLDNIWHPVMTVHVADAHQKFVVITTSKSLLRNGKLFQFDS